MGKSAKAEEPVSAPIQSAAGRALAHLRAGGGLYVGNEDDRVHIPEPVARKVEAVLLAYAVGRSPAVMSPEDDLTSQEAADLLGLSRPTVVKMIDAGKLPSHKPGAHRRVRLADLLAFKTNLDRERHAALDRLAALGQAMEQYALSNGGSDDDMI